MTSVELTLDGERAYVTLNRPAKHNGLTLEMLGELASAAAKIGREKGVRAVVLRGAGPSFCSGLDIGKAASSPLATARHFLQRPWRGTNTFQEACWAWQRLPVPVIAVLHGRCYGAGLQLAAAADFRFSTADCEFSVMEARYGLVPDMTATVTLPRLIGLDQALLLTMTADVIDGTRAHQIGLVTGVSADPGAEATGLIERISRRSPDAVAAAKHMFTSTWNSGPRRAFAAEQAAQLRMLLGANSAIARKEGDNAQFRPRG